MTSTRHRPALEAVSLHRRFHSGSEVIDAVDGVSLTVCAGEVVAVEGPSGSGKSTLLHLLAGLDRPDRGEVLLAGRRLDQLNERERTRLRRRSVGLVLQSFDLLPTLDAVDNVALPAILDGVRVTSARQRAAGLLEQVGLSRRASHRPGQLSGGEQQRVCIARALVNDAPLVVADEPTAALDSVAGDDVLGLLRQLAADGRAVVVATHDPRAAAHAHRSLRLVDGRIVWPERALRVVDEP